MELREAIKAFLKDLGLSGKSKKTLEAYYFHLEKFFSFCEERKLDYRVLNGKESKAFRNWLAMQGLNSSSINAILSACKSFYDFLLEEELVKGNPFVSRKLRVKVPERKPAFLTEEELKKVKSAMERLPRHIQLAFETMLWTGLRVSEVVDLTGKDVFQKSDKVLLRVRFGKGAKERIVPVLNEALAEELIELSKQKGAGSLFGVKAGTLKYYAYKVKKASGVDFHCHRLRHSLATELLANRVRIDIIQKILGHSSINTTRWYAETLPEDIEGLNIKIYRCLSSSEQEESFPELNKEQAQTKKKPNIIWLKKIQRRW
jgi:integrase/recombinase XerC/integrase/recombinase XerD